MSLITGRIDRKTYIAGTILAVALIFAVSFLLDTLLSMTSIYELWDGLAMIVYVVFLMLCWGSLAYRRARDFGVNGLIFVMLSYLLPPTALALAIIPGSKGANKYGPRPQKQFRWGNLI